MPKPRRHQPSKEELLDRLPRGLRPKLSAKQQHDLGMTHVQNLDAIASGQADLQLLMDYVEQVMTWVRVAQLLDTGAPEMMVQLEVATRLVERYGRTGRVGFDGPDYQLAKVGLVHMDQLASLVDEPNALAATVWARCETNAMVKLAVQYREKAAA